MFSSGSPYSPFFTSGLLPAATPGPRRGSLPTDSLAPTTPSACSVYFALQPARDEKEYRSFLSLDLAESQAQLPPVSQLSPPVPASPQSLRLRYSRDSLRSIPSPKPAPSSTLPELPKAVPRPTVRVPVLSAPPRLPSIPNVASFDLMAVSRTSPPTHVVSLPKRALPSTASSVSTRARKINRTNALDRLEGRLASQITTTPASMSNFSARRNFMSLSDDESDDDSDVDSLDAKSDYSDDFFDGSDNDRLFYTGFLEPEDLVLPPVSVPTSPTRPKSPPSRRYTASPTKGSFGPRKQAARRSTKDWFPLKSFIDLHGNEDASTLGGSVPLAPSASASSPSSSWTWRSFIDVAHLP